jgi:hypothetical protein
MDSAARAENRNPLQKSPPTDIPPRVHATAPAIQDRFQMILWMNLHAMYAKRSEDPAKNFCKECLIGI